MNRPAPPAAAALLLLTPLTALALQPLVTDDTATQGTGRWQIETGVEQTPRQGDDDRQRHWNATLTSGLADPLDIYVSAPYTYPGSPGSGWNDAVLGLKWRWAEQGPFSLAVKPEIRLPTGDQRRGLGAGRAGADATLLAQWQTGPLTLLGNAGWIWQPNRQGERWRRWQFSGAALYRASDLLQLALDAVVTRHPAPGAETDPAFLIAAAICSPRPWLDLDLGYRYGLNRQSDHHALMMGLTARW
jgi:hypothetical protein